MGTVTVHCPHCSREALVQNGRAPNGKQKYLCRACKRQSRENPTPHAYPEERREEILRAYEERRSLRGSGSLCVARLVKLSLIRWEIEVKKPVVAYGRPFRPITARTTVVRILGSSIRQCFQKSSTAPWEKRLGKRLMLNVGTIRSDNVWLALSAKHYPSRNRS